MGQDKLLAAQQPLSCAVYGIAASSSVYSVRRENAQAVYRGGSECTERSVSA